MIKNQKFFALSRTGKFVSGEKEHDFPLMITRNDISSLFQEYHIMGEKCEPKEISDDHGKLDYLESENFIVVSTLSPKRFSPRILLRIITRIRKNLGYQKLLYIPGISDPYLIPALFYIGVDVFDNITAKLEGSMGTKYTIFGRSNGIPDYSNENSEFVKEELDILRSSCENGMLTEVVEKYCISHKSNEILRILKQDYYDIYEEMYPRTTPGIYAGSLESIQRPDIVRYNSFIRDEYIKPNNSRIALFIPCSAHKPYSESKTHMELIEALGKYRREVHEIIISSPVTLVPRELEEVYPPAFYDIPVTGRWYQEEIDNIRSGLNSFLKRNQYDKVIFFLPKDMTFIEDFSIPNSTYILWDKRSPDSFSKLIDSIASFETTEKYQRNFLMEKMQSVATYQFGNWIIPHIEKMKIIRSYNQHMLTMNGKPILIYNERLGKLSINREGASIFMNERKFCVEIDNFQPTANIYAMGVMGSTDDIRSEDEIVVHCNGDIRGVGIAKMPHALLGKAKKGVAVKMRN